MKKKKTFFPPFKLNLFAKEANIDKPFFLKKFIKKKIFNESKDKKPKNYHPK